MCCVAFRRKSFEWRGFDTIAYLCPGYGGFITVTWPTGWPAPATGTFGGGPGILPKEYFGGKGGVEKPTRVIPDIRPDYEVAPDCPAGKASGAYATPVETKDPAPEKKSGEV